MSDPQLTLEALADLSSPGRPSTDSVDMMRAIVRSIVAEHPEQLVPIILETVAYELRKVDYRRRHPGIS